MTDSAQSILLLDDEENILRALRRLLYKDGYKVFIATNAEDAFELLASHPIQVVISDQRMPKMSGTEFLSQVKSMYPDTIRMVLSGYADVQAVNKAIDEGGIHKFMTKPWDDQQLRTEIKQAFQRWAEKE